MIKLISINIERSKHLERVIPLLQREQADVVCLQELMEYDIARMESVAGSCMFTPMSRHPAEGRTGAMGLGIFTRMPLLEQSARYYHGNGLPDRIFDLTDARSKHESESHAVACIDVEKDAQRFRIATTHFTWTPHGGADDFQREDLKKLFAVLSELNGFVLCGDFNAPRGGEIFDSIAAIYKDNIPLKYKTSIDVNLHRAGRKPSEKMDEKMVDGLFSTPEYVVTDVRLHPDVSDHMAVTAAIRKQQ